MTIADAINLKITIEAKDALANNLKAKHRNALGLLERNNAQIDANALKLAEVTLQKAVKATYGEVNGVGREIFKDPITDDGTKKSKKGLLGVFEESDVKGQNAYLVCEDQLSWEDEATGKLTTVFKDGKLIRETNLEQIRERLKVS